MPFERFLVKAAMHATIAHDETLIHLNNISDSSLAAGGHLYLENCAFCHGLPDQAPTGTAKGMSRDHRSSFSQTRRRSTIPPAKFIGKLRMGSA